VTTETPIESRNDLKKLRSALLKYYLLLITRDKFRFARSDSYLLSNLQIIISKKIKEKNMFFNLLRRLLSIKKFEDEYLKKNIERFLEKSDTLNDLKADDETTLENLINIFKSLEKINLPAWEELRNDVLQPFEMKFPGIKNKDVFEAISKIIAYYGYVFDESLYNNFIPGQQEYNVSLYDKRIHVKGNYPHNTIVDVILLGIKDKKTGIVIRKPWVDVCFGY